MTALDGFAPGAALLTALALIALVVHVWRRARFVEREQGSVKGFEAGMRALAHATGHDG